MLAAVYHGRHDIRVQQWPAPPNPPPDWVTVGITYCGICGTDIDEYLHGPVVIPTAPHPLTGAQAPLVLGHEGVGVVVATGAGSGIEPGTRVGLENSVGCGHCAACLSGNRQLCPQLAVMGLMLDGALAEAVNVPASMCAELPAGLPDEAGALAESLGVAVRAVRRADTVAGVDVHVFGAGTIGLMAAQVARAAGARSITLRDPSTRRLGRAETMGFEVAPPGPDGRRVPVVFECTGTAAGLSDSLSATAKSGTTVVLGVHDRPREIDLVAMLLDERVLLASLSHAMNDDYIPAIELLNARKVDFEPLITDRIPLRSAVDRGFKALVEDPEDHLKILIDCRP
ncbi:MAG: alcohol dehydrogenase catalytic domain-containing protein [Candidatus Dormibacteraeota bacterium]|nr:alcohol dehydrogenase catalytic domain-containing protein [Candidatus Dormibacteraeota bacterium]